ncbi:MAG: response regulator [Gammaproteobacteria bacterium]|nr:response regulator [Gammaproteobacteria bacterium]
MISSKSYLNARILIADDNSDHLFIIQKLLKSSGFTQVHTTDSALKVHSLHRQHQFDLLLLDYNMPEMSGVEILRVIRQEAGNEHLPIIIISSAIDSETRIEALNFGATDVVLKDLHNRELVSRVANFLRLRFSQLEAMEHIDLLNAKIRLQSHNIENAGEDAINRLMTAVHFRDNETAEHLERMSSYARILARGMGMTDAEAEVIYKASPMHDIGKISIPDSILLKKGKLNGDEWQSMKSHTIIGAQLLSGHESEVMKMASVIALTHHEKWDGTGYPYGLKRGEIALPGRIVALADVFDALTSERPYKPAWSLDRAMETIISQSGLHFSPEVVEIFKQSLDEIIQTKNAINGLTRQTTSGTPKTAPTYASTPGKSQLQPADYSGNKKPSLHFSLLQQSVAGAYRQSLHKLK